MKSFDAWGCGVVCGVGTYNHVVPCVGMVVLGVNVASSARGTCGALVG